MQGDFVIQVRPDADPAHGVLRGRIEHVDSGHSARFQSIEELVSFIAAHIQPAQDESAEAR